MHFLKNTLICRAWENAWIIEILLYFVNVTVSLHLPAFQSTCWLEIHCITPCNEYTMSEMLLHGKSSDGVILTRTVGGTQSSAVNRVALYSRLYYRL